MKFILFCVTLDLSDNLTEMRIVKNSYIYMFFSGHDSQAAVEGRGRGETLSLTLSSIVKIGGTRSVLLGNIFSQDKCVT